MSAPTILDEIVQAKLRQIELQKQQLSLETIKDGLQHSDRDFLAALKQPQPAFILECKKASPSKGLIRPDFDLASIATTYSHYASAISVLTEPEYFQGSLDYLQIVRNRASQPLLCKDFLIEPYQVFQARYFGADAVLLILAILTDEQWTELFTLAQSLSMDAITEVSNETEMLRAKSLGAPIVGINNRNLRDMSIDLGTTRKLAADLPKNTFVISESGFFTNNQIRAMFDCADGFLIGSSLMAEENLSRAIKKIIFGQCKVCGLTRNEDARVADQAGATYGGVIFAESSPRQVNVDQARQVFHETDLSRVGVFQNQSVDQIAEMVDQCQLDVIQLHGDEEPQMTAALTGKLGQREMLIWKAVTVDQCESAANSWLGPYPNVKLLVDNRSSEAAGGTGETFDWGQLPEQWRDRIIVAGGIGPDNVAAAMRLGCCGVDMNSKLETQPGIKSSDLIRSAFHQIRNYRRDG